MVYHSWGAAVLFWLVHRLGGLSLAVLLRGLLVGAAYALTWLTCRKLGAGRISSAFVLLLAVLASSNNWSLRPQLFAYPLFALSLYLLYRWQHGNEQGCLLAAADQPGMGQPARLIHHVAAAGWRGTGLWQWE